MANLITIKEEKESEILTTLLFKGMQSCNINFLIGAGCSNEAIPYDNTIEQKFSELLEKDDLDSAIKEKYKFLDKLIDINEELYRKTRTEKIKKVLDNYKNFIRNLNSILSERKSTIIHKQANIFSTNYDLFIEQAAAELDIVHLNDGFRRNTNLRREYVFSNREFFNYTCHRGSFFDYKADIPAINLIKLHGSLSWRVTSDLGMDQITFSTAYKRVTPEDIADIEKLKEFNSQVSIVFPDTVKYEKTVTNHNYYDLIRIFSQELEKENTILLVCGFGFNDSHIEEIIKRALGNPTLYLFIFAYSKEDVDRFRAKFAKFNNVSIIYKENAELSFENTTGIIESLLKVKHE